MRHYLCGRAHGHARFTTRPRRTGFHWREGPAKRVRERTAMYPRHRGSVVPRDPDSVDVSQGLELCSQPWRTAGCGSPRAHPPRTIPKLRAEAAPCPLRVNRVGLTGNQPLPVYLEQQTSSHVPHWSGSCHEGDSCTAANHISIRSPRWRRQAWALHCFGTNAHGQFGSHRNGLSAICSICRCIPGGAAPRPAAPFRGLWRIAPSLPPARSPQRRAHTHT
jgi:hypothetical protein